MSLRVARILPITPATEIRGALLGFFPCPTHWGPHACHHCAEMIGRYTPQPPMQDGYVEELHEGAHRCACGETQD